MKRLTTEEFIQKAKQIHGNKYDYSQTVYVNGLSKIKIICSVHGVFEQRAYAHLSGQSCPHCYGNAKLTAKQFIQKARKVHDDKYDYSMVEYINNYTKVKIICPKHGVFEQIPNSHLQGRGCTICGDINTGINLMLDKDDFIQKAKAIHGDKYD